MNIQQKDRSKSAFDTHSSAYQYIRIRHGLTNVVASLQRAIDIILTNYKWEICFANLDDIIIFSNCIEENMNHVDDKQKILKKPA